MKHIIDIPDSIHTKFFDNNTDDCDSSSNRRCIEWSLDCGKDSVENNSDKTENKNKYVIYDDCMDSENDGCDSETKSVWDYPDDESDIQNVITSDVDDLEDDFNVLSLSNREVLRASVLRKGYFLEKIDKNEEFCNDIRIILAEVSLAAMTADNCSVLKHISPTKVLAERTDRDII